MLMSLIFSMPVTFHFLVVFRKYCKILRFWLFSLEAPLPQSLRNSIQLTESSWLFRLVLMSKDPISSKLFAMLQTYNTNNRRQPCITVGQVTLTWGRHWLCLKDRIYVVFNSLSYLKMQIFFNETSYTFVGEVSANKGEGIITIRARGEILRWPDKFIHTNVDERFGRGVHELTWFGMFLKV
jgi:hypothetical protein